MSGSISAMRVMLASAMSTGDNSPDDTAWAMSVADIQMRSLMGPPPWPTWVVRTGSG